MGHSDRSEAWYPTQGIRDRAKHKHMTKTRPGFQSTCSPDGGRSKGTKGGVEGSAVGDGERKGARPEAAGGR